MKKTFLIAGLIACIGATNSYADIVISQADDNPDMVVTVARAAKDTQNTKKDQLTKRPKLNALMQLWLIALVTAPQIVGL